jgi:hypothetical protein
MMFKKLLKSFSIVLIFAALFYSCGEQVFQPPVAYHHSSVIYQKTGLVAYTSTQSTSQEIVNFNTGMINVNGYKHLRIVFKGLTNSDGSTISLYLNSDKGSQQIYTVSSINGINEGDHAIEIEEPAEKIWLSMFINMHTAYIGDENIKFTQVSDFMIYGTE